MKDQYVGDINDYRKYALLRALAAEGSVRTGVCWMLTPPDGRNDGRKLEYLRDPDRFRHLDRPLFDVLVEAAAVPDQRRLVSIEESGILPGAMFHNAVLSDDRAERTAYMEACRAAFREADLVFLDPDNGLEIGSVAKGRRNSSKFAYLDEVGAFYEAGASVLVYQHFPRSERQAFTASCATRLRSVAAGATVWAYATSHVVFLLLLHPAAPAGLTAAAEQACSLWPASFIRGAKIEAADERPAATAQ